jgi:hypothetical protein
MITIAPNWSNPPHPAGPNRAGKSYDSSGMPFIALLNSLPTSADDTGYAVSTSPPEIIAMSLTAEELPVAVMDMLTAARQPVASRSFAFSDLGVFGREAPFAMADLPQDGIRTIGHVASVADALLSKDGDSGITSSGNLPSSVPPQLNTSVCVMEQAPAEIAPLASTATPHFLSVTLASSLMRAAISTPNAIDTDIGGALPAVLIKMQPMRPSPLSLTATEGVNAVSITVRCANLSADIIQVLKRRFADVAREYGVNLGDFLMNGVRTTSTIDSIEGVGHGRLVG